MRRRVAAMLLGFTFALTGSIGLTQLSDLQPAAAASGRFCSTSDFGFATWSNMRTYLNNQYGPPNKKAVWQSPSDNSTWLTWCKVTKGNGRLNTDTGVATPSVVYLSDGARIQFRATSKSGGFTIDINFQGALGKVHRI